MSSLPVIFILATIVIDAMGIGLILPVMPDLIRDVTGGTLASAALWGGILSTAFAVMQFLFGPLVGNLSDRYGRRPILLVSLGVMAADYLVMATAAFVWLLLVGRIVGGITAATQSTATAYIADISPPEKKAQNFGLIGAAFGAGFVLGPVIGGLLAHFGPRAPFYAAAALAAANMALGASVLPETVTDRIRRPFDWARANPFAALARVGRMPGLGRLLLLMFLYDFAFMVYPSVWAYFGQARFGWEPSTVGLSLAGFGLSMAIVQGVLMPYLIRLFGDRGVVFYGFAFNAAAFGFLGLVTNGTLALIATPITALGAVVTPALQAMLSRGTHDNEQGELQGTISSVLSLATIASPLVMTQIFSRFTAADAPVFAPGAPFLLSMALMAVCAVVFAGRAPTPRPMETQP